MKMDADDKELLESVVRGVWKAAGVGYLNRIDALRSVELRI